MADIGRIAFLGTGAFGVPLLARVADMADELVVVSQPDRPAGRRLQLRSTPVTAYAREHGIRVLTPHRLRSAEAREALAEFRPDGLVLVAYGQLVPQDLLDMERGRRSTCTRRCCRATGAPRPSPEPSSPAIRRAA